MTGGGIGSHGAGISGKTAPGTTTVKKNAKVPFATQAIKEYAAEIASDERHHVNALRNAFVAAGVTPPSRPDIDLLESFNTLAQAAGMGESFDPFADEISFLVGSFIFEDVGVSAYHGGALLIQDKVNILPPAVGIHAVEAYHAGLVRTSINSLDAVSTTPGTLLGYTQKISALRSSVANPSPSTTVDDYGVMTVQVPLNTSTSASVAGTTSYPATTIADANVLSTSIAAGRTTTQVIAIVTGGNAKGDNTGGFFPNALNGTIGAKITKS